MKQLEIISDRSEERIKKREQRNKNNHQHKATPPWIKDMLRQQRTFRKYIEENKIILNRHDQSIWRI